ncbi:replication initiation protein RepC [Notoacmeibacter marinus]|uniref:replication initiation protein RepC n=1 Tax=Notoacmeibacter marinus TaxID=1876515 RepID=UPI003CCB5CE6
MSGTGTNCTGPPAKSEAWLGFPRMPWNLSQKALGPAVAAAAIALIFDKHTTGEVKSPGRYLRGMVEKAWAGELHLDRSFYGRLSKRRHASTLLSLKIRARSNTLQK